MHHTTTLPILRLSDWFCRTFSHSQQTPFSAHRTRKHRTKPISPTLFPVIWGEANIQSMSFDFWLLTIRFAILVYIHDHTENSVDMYIIYTPKSWLDLTWWCRCQTTGYAKPRIYTPCLLYRNTAQSVRWMDIQNIMHIAI